MKNRLSYMKNLDCRRKQHTPSVIYDSECYSTHSSLYSNCHCKLTNSKESGGKAIYYFSAEPPLSDFMQIQTKHITASHSQNLVFLLSLVCNWLTNCFTRVFSDHRTLGVISLRYRLIEVWNLILFFRHCPSDTARP